jgi:hypothetical protein
LKVDEKKPMAPCPGKSTPASTQRKTSKSAINKFSEIAAKEEETTQRVIELKRTKLKASTNREIAKVKSKAEIKINQDRLCAELEMKKMEYEYRFKLAAVQPGGPPQSLPSLSKIPDLPMLQTIRLFFFSLTCVCLMPSIFTYLNTSLPAGTHESLNT